MKMRFLTTLTALAASVLVAGNAGAITVAGWDFSQYFGENLLSVDGATFTDTLTANYSNLDPTFSAGAESAQYGTMFINGQHGSTAVDVASGTPAITPIFPSLASNINAPVPGAIGAVPFDSLSVQIAEGQTFANTLAMGAQAPVSLVFEATLVPDAAHTGSAWGVTFGGKTLSGTSVVGVSFSLDGVSYGSATNVNLDTNDTPFSVAFSGGDSETLFVKFSMNPTNGTPLIDNVSLNATLKAVPEPGAAVLLGAGLALVGALRRRSA